MLPGRSKQEFYLTAATLRFQKLTGNVDGLNSCELIPARCLHLCDLLL